MDNINTKSINNSVDAASSSSNVGNAGADVIDTGVGCVSSLLTPFWSIVVEEQGGMELLSSPSKNQKNPSGCLTGTPSSSQRPCKMRQSTLTPVRAIDYCPVAMHSAATALVDTVASRVLLPPDIMTNEDIQSTISMKPTLPLSTSNAQNAFYSSLTDQVKSRFKGFQYKSAIPVTNGAIPGYKRCMTVGETTAKEFFLKGDLWAIKVNRCEELSSVERPRTRGFDGKNGGVEELVRYYCLAKGCKCLVLIARIAGGLLAYELIDKECNLPYKHSGHDDLNPSLKLDDFSLTHAQKIYIMNDGAVLLQRCEWMSIVEAMISDPFVCVNNLQCSLKHKFAERIRYYANRQKSKGTLEAVDKQMKGDHVQGILDHLKGIDRLNVPDDHTIPFTKTNHFNSLWKNILVSDHDYTASGGAFNYICAEYIDSLARAKKAVDMFGNDGVQGEMDFFHVPGVGADWQVGHIGFSDHNHRYFILCMIICHSENAISARLLINRAVRLINESGGRLRCILVDGGTALNKAIGDENAQNELLQGYCIQKRRCFAHIIRMVRFTSSVVDSMSDLRTDHNLFCIIIVSPQPFSRGGGYRGGRGSLPKALLDNKVSHAMMGKIVGLILMISYIAPNDRGIFLTAVEMLKIEFKQHLSDNIIKQYLSGDLLGISKR